MVATSVGLKTHIWNNNLRCMLILALYPVLLIGVAWLLAFVSLGLISMERESGIATEQVLPMVNAAIYQYWPVILGGVALWFGFAWLSHTKLIRRMTKSHPVSRKDEPELYNLLENLCIAQGVPMPHLEIIETHARNAYASGIDQKSYAITVTRGLLNSLTRDEVEAVLAHELAHIMNNDVRLLIVTIIFAGLFTFLLQLAWNSLRYGMFRGGGSSKNRGGGIIFVLAVVAVLSIGYLISVLMRFMLSRKREYMADAGAVEMTKNPEAMMSALLRIKDRSHVPAMSNDVAQMCIDNQKPFWGMFATHPPIDRRISVISAMTGAAVPALEHTGPAPKAERLNKNNEPGDNNSKNPWLILQRPGRQGQ